MRTTPYRVIERKKKQHGFPWSKQWNSIPTCIYEKAPVLEIFCLLVQFMKSLWRKQCFISRIVWKPFSDMGNLCTTIHSLLNSGHNNFFQMPLFNITWIICKQNGPEKVLRKLPLNTFLLVKNSYHWNHSEFLCKYIYRRD